MCVVMPIGQDDIISQFQYYAPMNKASFTKDIFLSYAAELKRFVAKRFGDAHDAEDIVQDAFHNFLRADSLESIKNPRAYLYQSAHNLALNRIRSQRNHTDYISQDSSDEEYRSPERVILAQKELETIEKILSKLPEKCRKAFILRRVHEKSFKEISGELSVTVSSVEKYLVKAVNYLRDNIDDLP